MSAKSEIMELTSFLHTWADLASINFINILPRVSLARNQVINSLNCYVNELCGMYPYLKMVLTESHRSLFSLKNGFRKSHFFSDKGVDNVHLNNLGISRLAKYLKYFAHND